MNLSDGCATAVETPARDQLSAPVQSSLIFSVSIMVSKIVRELDAAI